MHQSEIVELLSGLKHRIFPRPFERLAISGKDLVGVEIGVYKGEHAQSLLQTLNIEHLYLIDPYELYAEYEEGKAHYGVDQEPLFVAQKEASLRLAKFSNKISWIKNKSSDALKNIPDNIDFVYIDGNHEECFVWEDINNYYLKVRPGGVIGGHDFYNGYCREHDGVVNAVTKFSVNNNLTLQVELPDWWIEK